ncbi:MAG: hypothetical protein IJH96_00545 [Ruminococcus sp.]|nr:hypothetical protein [Ruminococcus sp.]
MKKFFAALAATAVMAISVVPAFASVNSPVATKPASSGSSSSSSSSGSVSPKTGSSDIAVYSVIALSLAGCAAASVALAKTKKKD